ncbi:MAG: hypothetical protein LBU32_02195 [Clostridiales bacterium]|jgi:hypothetical protein|nr:hypothetical protein [Clostridiales bacterium]
MKRTFLAILAIVAVLIMQTSAFAATKQEVMDQARASSSNFNGRTAPIPDKYYKSLADFLNTNEFSQSEVDGMITNIQEARAIALPSGTGYFSRMSQSIQNSLVSKAGSAATTVGAKLSFDGRYISIVSRSGRIYTIDSAPSGSWSVQAPSVVTPPTPVTPDDTSNIILQPQTPVTPGSPEVTPGRPVNPIIKATGAAFDFTMLYALIAALVSAVAVFSVAVFVSKNRRFSHQF